MLIVGIIITTALVLLFVWAAKSGQFDDSNKMIDGMLFDSTDDLNDAIKKEKKIKEAKESKVLKMKEEKTSHKDD
jgi:cbb3-type cytochrome oxidase maturation protein